MVSYIEQIRAKAEEKQRLTKENNARPGLLLSRDRGPTTYRLELAMFVFTVAKEMSDLVMTNFIESRECRLTLGLDPVNCTEPLSQEVENLVQPGTSSLLTAKYMVESFLPSFLAVLVGPWSDQYGRKPFLTAGVTGYALASLTLAVLSLMPDVTPSVLLVATAPIVATGGYFSIHLLCFCYISDITDIRGRAMRLGIIHLIFMGGAAVAPSCVPTLLSIQKSLNPYGFIFFISTSMLCVVAIYIHYGLRETVEVYQIRECRSTVLSSIKATFTTCLTRRENHARTILLLLVWVMAIALSISSAEELNIYLSARKLFSWQLSDFATFRSYEKITSALGTLTGAMLLVDWLGLTNISAMILISALRCLHSVIMALATDGYMFYLASTVNIFFFMVSPFCRTELSLLVPSEDLGKAFSFMAFHESTVPMIFTPLYSYVYQATLSYSPGFIYWLSAALTLLTTVMLLIALYLQRMCNQ